LMSAGSGASPAAPVSHMLPPTAGAVAASSGRTLLLIYAL
jgi:hypothetical protein